MNIDDIEFNNEQPINSIDESYDDPIDMIDNAQSFNVDTAIVNAAMINAYNKGTSIKQELEAKELESISYKNKLQVFKDVIDEDIKIKNDGLMSMVNEQKIESPEDAEFLINYARENQKLPKEEYTEDDIIDVQTEVYSHAGQKFETEKEYLDYVMSPKNISLKSQYQARETLNNLIENDGILNEAASLGASIIGKTLVDGFVGDFTNETVMKDIEEYQSITDPKLKMERAKQLAHAFYEGTGKNTFTTRFLIEQLEDPNFKNNINNDVFQETAMTVAFGLGDIVTAGKLVKASTKLATSTTKEAVSKTTKAIAENIKKASSDIEGNDIIEVVDKGVSQTPKGFKKTNKIKRQASEIATKILKGVSSNPVKSMESLGNNKGAADTMAGVVVAAKEQPELAAKLTKYSGLDLDDLNDLASITNQKELDAIRKTKSTLPNDYETVREYQNILRNIVDKERGIKDYDIIKDTDLTRAGVTEQDKLKHIERLSEDLEIQKQKVLDDKEMIYDLHTELKRDLDADTVTITKILKMKDGTPDVVKSETVHLGLNIVDGFSILEKNKYDISKIKTGDFFMSEEARQVYGINYGSNVGKQMLTNDLTAVINQGQTFEDIAKRQVKSFVKSRNALNKKQKQTLDMVLRKGDEYTSKGINIGKDYNIHELKAMGADENTINAYFEFRTHANSLLSIKNKDKRDELISKGYAEYEFDVTDEIVEQLKNSSTSYQLSDNKLKYFGAEINDGGSNFVKGINKSAQTSVKANDPKAIVFMQEKGVTVKLMDVPDEAFEGSKLIKLVSPVGMNDNSVTYALVKSFSKKQLPEDVIEKRAGWVPRKYKARHYIYFENEYGKAEVLSATIRASDVDAELKALQLQHPDKKLFVRTEGQDVAVKESATGGFLDNLDVSVESDLNLTIGKRKQNLMVDSKGNRIETEDLYEVLGNQIRVASASRPMNIYRASLLKRAEKTIANVQSISGKQNILKNPANILEGIKDEFVNEFKDEVRLIDFLNKRVVDPSDPHFKKYSENMKSFVNYLDDKAGKTLPPKLNEKMGVILKGAYELENLNPIQGLKALSFIRLLGFFDVRQVVLQAMQTTAIVSINPVNGTKGIRDYAMWKLMKKNFRRNPNSLNDIMKKAETDLTDMEHAVMDLNNSNVLSSISTNADLTLQNYGVFSKAKNKLDTFIEKGMFFYDMGNEMVYSTAFFAARREILNGAKRQLTKEEMIKVQSLTNKYAYNFTAANKAGFQDGAWSSAFQFMQVPAKAYESLATSTLTNAEKLRLLAGQGLFFGYAGVPMGEAFASYLSKTFGMSEEETINKYSQEIKDFENGFVGYLLSNVLDYEVSTDNLAFFGAGVTDIPLAPIFTSLLKTDDSIQAATILKESFGPSFDTATKGYSLLSNTSKALGSFIVGDIDEGYSKAREAIFSSDSELMKFFGTTSKISKAIMILETGTDVDKYGNRYVKYEEDEKLQRAVGAMFGFEDIKKQEAFVLRDQERMLRDREKWIEETTLNYYMMMEKDGLKQEQVKNAFYIHMKKNDVPLQTAYEIWNKVNARVVDKITSEDVTSKAFQNVRDAVFRLHESGEEALDSKAYTIYQEKKNQ